MRDLGAVLALALTVPAPAALADEVPVTVVLVGDEEPVGNVRRALAGQSQLPVEVQFAELPNSPGGPPAPDEGEPALGRARSAYVEADFDRCLSEVGDERRIHELLGAARRSLATRTLFWRIACLVGADDRGAADRAASRFVTFGLAVPPDVEAVSPDVEALLDRARGRAEQQQPVPLEVTATARARVALDGRTGLCTTPCTVEVGVGDHVLRVVADGFVPEWRLVRVEGPDATATFDLAAASPEIASEQWTARYATSTEIDSTASVELLSRAVRARRLLLLTADTLREGARVRGVLSIDGTVAARAERAAGSSGDVDELTDALLRDLLVEGEVVEPAPGLLERPLFWIAVGIVAALAAGTTAYLLIEPDTRTEVGF
jgi:hypothetical protein